MTNNKKKEISDFNDKVDISTDGQAIEKTNKNKQKEIGGQKGPEPTRYGDWEKGGRCTDF